LRKTRPLVYYKKLKVSLRYKIEKISHQTIDIQVTRKESPVIDGSLIVGKPLRFSCPQAFATLPVDGYFQSCLL
jgi:hypothetical protein